MDEPWDGSLYAQNTAHHRAYDDVLLSRLSGVAVDARILDVGCGAGDFTAGLVSVAPSAAITGVDAHLTMVQQAQRVHAASDIDFRQARAQDVGQLFAADSFDVVVSTACLHWVPGAEHPAMLRGFFDVLAASGQLCAEFGGRGQLDAVRGVLDPLAAELGGAGPAWYFPDDGEYSAIATSAGFVVDDCQLLRQRRDVPDAASFKGWLTSQVLMAYKPSLPDEAWTEFAEAAVTRGTSQLRRHDGTYDVDYVRLLIDTRKA